MLSGRSLCTPLAPGDGGPADRPPRCSPVVQLKSAGGQKSRKAEKAIGEVITDAKTLYVQSSPPSALGKEAFKKQNPLGNKSGDKESIKDGRGVYTHKCDAHAIGYIRRRCTAEKMFASAAEYGAAISG